MCPIHLHAANWTCQAVEPTAGDFTGRLGEVSHKCISTYSLFDDGHMIVSRMKAAKRQELEAI